LSERTVHCLRCDALIEQGDPPDLGNPQACPECGSLERRVTLGPVKSDLGITGTAEVAPKIDSRKKMTITGEATHSCELRITPPSDDFQYWYAEVRRDDEVVGNGGGDTIVNAFVGMIEYMLPPDHHEYPNRDPDS
jgi:hypothetical protein